MVELPGDVAGSNPVTAGANIDELWRTLLELKAFNPAKAKCIVMLRREDLKAAMDLINKRRASNERA